MDYIPNIISGLRILLIPIFALIFLLNNYNEIALYLFMIMGFTDALDGALARYLNESIFGAYLDAVADKLMINTAFFILCICKHTAILYFGYSISKRFNNTCWYNNKKK
jgi:cardiolipin synthase